MESEFGDEDLEAQMEAFMQRQAEIEAGESKRKAEPGMILGEAEVSEEDAKAYCRDIVQVMKSLRQGRDMTVNEIKLTISIEDPRAREQRMMGIEDSRGVSRDELAEALTEVSEGRVPRDRIALRELRNEMVNWPFLELEGGEPQGVERLAPATTPAEDDARADWRQKGDIRPPVGRGPDEKDGNVLTDLLGYGTLCVKILSSSPLFSSLLLSSPLFSSPLFSSLLLSSPLFSSLLLSPYSLLPHSLPSSTLHISGTASAWPRLSSREQSSSSFS